jgi:hypothetical protein
MECSNCQTPNLDGARFCINCGTPLPVQCPNCGHSNPAQAKFCSNCGHKLVQALEEQPTPPDSGQEHTPPLSAQSILHQLIPNQLMRRIEQTGSSLVGERRVVTMLFCDVKDSTAAARGLGPRRMGRSDQSRLRAYDPPGLSLRGHRGAPDGGRLAGVFRSAGGPRRRPPASCSGRAGDRAGDRRPPG